MCIAMSARCGRAESCAARRDCLLRKDGFSCMGLGDRPCTCVPEHNGPALSERHAELMRHCIGLDRGNGKPYKRHGRLFFRPTRNYFDCGPADEPAWREIESSGLAYDAKLGDRPWFKLTAAGFAWLSERMGVHVYDDIARGGEQPCASTARGQTA